jgi:hypothetical protein
LVWEVNKKAFRLKQQGNQERNQETSSKVSFLIEAAVRSLRKQA